MFHRLIGSIALFAIAGALFSSQACSEDECSRGLCDDVSVICPKTVPAEGSACKLRNGIGAPSCNYGDAGEVVTTCTCVQRDADGRCPTVWSYNAGCPVDVPNVGSACPVQGRTCDYPAASVRALCGCTSNDGPCDWRHYSLCVWDASNCDAAAD